MNDRYSILDDTTDRPFGQDTVGIVDENEGGIVLYVHRLNAERVLEALAQAEAKKEGEA